MEKTTLINIIMIIGPNMVIPFDLENLQFFKKLDHSIDNVLVQNHNWRTYSYTHKNVRTFPAMKENDSDITREIFSLQTTNLKFQNRVQ